MKRIEVTEEPQTVGIAYLACELCPEKIPVSVDIWAAKDDEGDDCVWTTPDTTDLELHMLAAHDLSYDADDEDEDESGDDEDD